VVKAPDLYQGDRKAAKVVYAISYLRGIAFNWVKTYVEDFMAHKNSDRQVNTLAREPTQRMFTSYKTFKDNIRQVFGDIE
jgi:hypothetical protein